MPKRSSDAAKRFPLNMRTTKHIRNKLELAANKAGRSLAQEVEFRLEQSFRDDSVMDTLARIEAMLSTKPEAL